MASQIICQSIPATSSAYGTIYLLIPLRAGLEHTVMPNSASENVCVTSSHSWTVNLQVVLYSQSKLPKVGYLSRKVWESRPHSIYLIQYLREVPYPLRSGILYSSASLTS